MNDATLAMRAAVVLAALVALVALALLERARGGNSHGLGTILRRRFVLGVPWGTLTTVAVVLAVYLFVQGGFAHWNSPIVIPFRAWSYLAPLGILTAGLAHGGPGHLLGNLMGTLVLAPLAEYAFGHFAAGRGESTFGAVRRNPYVRAFVVFPALAVLLALVSAAFSLGPVIGFSGVVYSFAGVALLYYPLATVVALSATSVLNLAYQSLRQPVVVASSRPSFYTPWWADIAIQGHALGLLAGILLAAALAARRGDDLPRPRRLALGALLFGVSQSLWTLYWYRGGETYVLYRAVGLSMVLLFAVLLGTLAVGDWRTLRLNPAREFLATLTPQNAAVVCLLVVTAALAGAAIPVNLTTVDDEPLPGDPIEVRGYTVTYAEDVENGMVSVVDVEAFGETTSVNTSGVVVRNPDRGVWTTATTKGRLAFAGRSQVVLGGLGWRDSVTAIRRGYSTPGGDVVYRITLEHDGERRVAYTSPPAEAEPQIDGQNVSVEANGTGFQLVVTRDNESARAPVPSGNETVTAGGLSFVRDGRRVFALTDDNETRVRVATRETYN
ncbi:rhomboid family intramembrane serine protease [Halorarum halophilum]|uniref:Rhomboid family intramembrane serine protease n=1 Tax=Halorarum halophilum TaxID=2743090 RepID=A0A7D5L2Q8_9EURY|nr:rhomboid family intramembrane serine protease [Halobaculum halophilum]QLG27483.1 rhomboid family intramembrane serine protease [Halobaculum halophilum]